MAAGKAADSFPGDTKPKARQIFVEVNPYHAISLFPYHGSLSQRADDVVLGHRRLFGEPLFDTIPATKRVAGVFELVRQLSSGRFEVCHFNTINAVLTPLNVENVRLWLTVMTLATVARAFGCRTSAIVHEADQFFSTGVDSCRRHAWFRRLVGRWAIAVFQDRYVLAPEVETFLRERGIHVDLLDLQSLAAFGKPFDAPPDRRRTLCWIGPIVSLRRDWRALLELDPERLKALDCSILMLCDARVGDGPAMRAAAEERGLIGVIEFTDHRPDDIELFEAVRRSDGILCLFGDQDYGSIKTSGARMIASGLQKPFISNRPSFGVYGADGRLAGSGDTVASCIEWLITSNRPQTSAPRPPGFAGLDQRVR